MCKYYYECDELKSNEEMILTKWIGGDLILFSTCAGYNAFVNILRIPNPDKQYRAFMRYFVKEAKSIPVEDGILYLPSPYDFIIEFNNPKCEYTLFAIDDLQFGRVYLFSYNPEQAIEIYYSKFGDRKDKVKMVTLLKTDTFKCCDNKR